MVPARGTDAIAAMLILCGRISTFVPSYVRTVGQLLPGFLVDCVGHVLGGGGGGGEPGGLHLDPYDRGPVFIVVYHSQ